MSGPQPAPPASLRRLTPGDLPALVALEEACFSHPWRDSAWRAELEAGRAWGATLASTALMRGAHAAPASSRNGQHDVDGRPAPSAPAAGVLAGAMAMRCAADEAELLRLLVDPGLRRQGLGRRLVEQAVALARAAGAATLLLEVRASAEAVAFYERLAFTRRGLRRAYYESPPEDALLLALPLGA